MEDQNIQDPLFWHHLAQIQNHGTLWKLCWIEEWNLQNGDSPRLQYWGLCIVPKAH